MSATSELHHELEQFTQAAEYFGKLAETRWTTAQFHALVNEGATAAWQNSGLPLRHVEIYHLVECAFRTAFRERVPQEDR